MMAEIGMVSPTAIDGSLAHVMMQATNDRIEPFNDDIIIMTNIWLRE